MFATAKYTSFTTLSKNRGHFCNSEIEYSFGFNGKEHDDEVAGAANCIVYEERIYDPRLGRFNSIDPRTSEYAWQTTYAYHLNSPISTIDYLGAGGPYDPKAAGETEPEGGNPPNSGTVDALFKESGGINQFSKTPSAYTMGTLLLEVIILKTNTIDS